MLVTHSRDRRFVSELESGCRRTYAIEPMQEIECALPLIPLSPLFNTIRVQHYDVEDNQSGLSSDLHSQRFALELEVANLKEKLTNELWLREALKSGLERSPGTLPKFPGYVPAKTRELLFEVAILEEEIIFLENHAVSLRQELQDDNEPGSFISFPPDSENEIVTVCKKPIVLEIEIPEIGTSGPPSTSEPTTPTLTVTPSVTPFATPEWGPSPSSSPSFMFDESIQLSSLEPSTFSLPLSMSSILVHGDESDSVPCQLNGNKLIRRGPSPSESLPANSDVRHTVVGKPSKKKATHKKSASLPSIARNAGNDAPRKSLTVKDVKSKSPPAAPLVVEKVYNGSKKSRRKEIHSRSPSLASSQLENKEKPYFRRCSSSREMRAECLPESTPSPIFEDEAMASIKCTVSTMIVSGSPSSKFHNCSSSPLTPTVQQGNQLQLVTPFKLPPTVKKKNIKELTLSDERRRTHDLVITRSLPPIKLMKASDKIVANPSKSCVQHRLIEENVFSGNGKACAKTKLSTTPTKQGSKVKPVQVQVPSSKSGDNDHPTSPHQEKVYPSNHRSGSHNVDNDDKDDKVEMACGPISDTTWLSEDLVRLFGSVCCKIRKHSSSSNSATSKMVVKPPALIGGSRKVFPYGRSQICDIRSQGALQLLQEYCSDDRGLSGSYDVRKHRALDVGPHRHHYKALKTTS